MATALRESLASNCRSQRLFLVGVLILLISPTLATAEVIFEDNFDDGLLDPRYSSDWGMWASQGYDGTNDPSPHPVMTSTEPGSSPVGCNVNNPFDACGPLDPPTLVGEGIPIPRPLDVPGKISVGVRGWLTLRPDPVNLLDPPGCDPGLNECGPCDPATQECFERADGTISIDDIDISNISTEFPVDRAGVHMGLTARMEGGAPGPVQRAIMGNYLTAFRDRQDQCPDPSQCGPRIFFSEFLYGTFGEWTLSLVELDHELESPIHMEMTVEGDDVTFTVGDEDEDHTITMVQGTHVHNTNQIPVDHMRDNPDPGRWGFFSMSAENSGTDYQTWNNFCFADVGETCGVQALPGDHDDDGDVDGNDFLLHQISDPSAINTDWGPNYGVVPLSGVAAVPEPSTLSLCALAAFALWPTRRQRV